MIRISKYAIDASPLLSVSLGISPSVTIVRTDDCDDSYHAVFSHGMISFLDEKIEIDPADDFVLDCYSDGVFVLTYTFNGAVSTISFNGRDLKSVTVHHVPANSGGTDVVRNFVRFPPR